MITKKLQSQGITVGSGGGGGGSSSVNVDVNTDCDRYSNCALCTSEKCVLCKEGICASNEYINYDDCSCKPCTDFNSNCIECQTGGCLKCNSGFEFNNGSCNECPVGYYCNGEMKQICQNGYYQDEQGKTSCKTCESKTENCSRCNSETGECEECKNGYNLSNGSCTSYDCGDLAVGITINGDKYCITKYNIGDNSAFAIPSGINVVTAGSGTCTSSTSVFCCWQGITSNDCTASNGDYSGCTRTLCDWHAADKACSALGYLGKTWRLPTITEWGAVGEQINEISINQGNKGLMLCDHTSATSGSAKCANGTCKGTNYSICDPDNLWSNTRGQYFFLEDGVFFDPSDAQFAGLYGQAYSVRCITNL